MWVFMGRGLDKMCGPFRRYIRIALIARPANGLESRLAGQIRDVMVEYLNCTIDLTCSIA
jgi:hypothetical protein